MKYPFVYILRLEKYNDIDNFILNNKMLFDCNIEIIDTTNYKLLNNLFNTNFHILVTYGESVEPYLPFVNEILVDRIRSRWDTQKIDNKY